MSTCVCVHLCCCLSWRTYCEEDSCLSRDVLEACMYVGPSYHQTLLNVMNESGFGPIHETQMVCFQLFFPYLIIVWLKLHHHAVFYAQ